MQTETQKLEYQLQRAKEEKNNILLKSMSDYFKTGVVRHDVAKQLLDYDNCIHNLQQRIYSAADKR